MAGEAAQDRVGVPMGRAQAEADEVGVGHRAPPPTATRPRATSPSCVWPRTGPPRVVRATILQDLLNGAIRRGRLDLAGLTGAVTAPSLTADLRGMAVWPWLHRVIGRSRDPRVRRLVSLLNGWAVAGSQRRAAGGVGRTSPPTVPLCC
jgi:hypothetical protein